MAKNIFEIISRNEAASICKIDATKTTLTTKPDEYIKANKETYYLLLNTWGCLFAQYAPYSWESLKYRIFKRGLVDCISELDNESKKFVHGGDDLSPFSLAVMNEVVTDKNWQQVFLLLLRFPKRFSPAKADALEVSALCSFKELENRNKLLMRKGYPYRIIKELKGILGNLLKSFKVDPKDRYFSSGAVAEGATLVHKLHAIAKTSRDLWGQRFILPSTNFEPQRYENSGTHRALQLCKGVVTEHIDHTTYPVYRSTVLCVPKTYKTPRIIAEEEAWRQYENSAVYRAILRCMQKSKRYKEFCIEDQNYNRDLCLKASLDCRMCTLDLSSASDSVTKLLIREIFPKEVLDQMYLPNCCLIGNKEYTLQMAATSGCILTFCIETLVFWAICEYCRLTYEAMTGEVLPHQSVYGDDIIVPVEIAEYVMDVLARFGFIVNKDKSFYTDIKYRESCGAEFLEGYDVSTRFWPRKCLEWDVNDKGIQVGPKTNLSLTSIIPLQHSLFEHKRASSFLIGFVRTIIPTMSSSNPTDGFQDLWEDFPCFELGYPPYDRKASLPSEEVKRPLHYYPISKWKDTESFDAAFEMFCYNQFLQHGPYFEEPIMELLGCSTSRLPYREACAKPTIKWVKRF